MTKSLAELRTDALEIFHAGLHAADPRAAVLRALTRRGQTLWLAGELVFDLTQGRVFVVGAGKAGAPMAQAVESVAEVTAGAVTVKYEHLAPTHVVKINEAGHPLPDENGVRGAQEIAQLLGAVDESDLVICVLSGGGSALFEWPVEGVTLDDLRALTQALLRCGATIYEINTLRKHLSRVKGGQLARLAQPARVIGLVLSDVLGSPLDVIASGPTAPDTSTFADCVAILEKYRLEEQIPTSIPAHLKRGARGEFPETPKAEDPLFARVKNVVIADNEIACAAAADEARARGYVVEFDSTMIQGEAREIGMELARRARALRGGECLLGGGEPTVTLHGDGVGGRAQELTLAAARGIAGEEMVVVLSAGTDGTDGPTDAAGAIADNTTLARAREGGLDPDAYLANNDAYAFFHPLGDLVITGPTNTNVNDLMIVVR